jgi:uncharacterized protein
MHGVIDIHTHAFPDAIATTALAALERSSKIKPYLNGTIEALLHSMDQSGIAAAVVCTMASRIEQFHPILDWCLSIRSPRIFPFPSLHPQDPDLVAHLTQIRDAGFKGIKLHPFVQDFIIDDPHLQPLFATLSELGLLVFLHTGYEINAPRQARARPKQVRTLMTAFPDLQLITPHLGGWDDWEAVVRHLIGQPIYMEVSVALDFLDQNRLRSMLLGHPPEYLLFGTDSPWTDQATTLKMLHRLGLPPDLVEQITQRNPARLLGLSAPA